MPEDTACRLGRQGGGVHSKLMPVTRAATLTVTAAVFEVGSQIIGSSAWGRLSRGAVDGSRREQVGLSVVIPRWGRLQLRSICRTAFTVAVAGAAGIATLSGLALLPKLIAAGLLIGLRWMSLR